MEKKAFWSYKYVRGLLVGILFVAATIVASLPQTAQPVVASGTCNGPAGMTGYFAGWGYVSNPVTVTCSTTVSRIRVWGEFYINGQRVDTADVTCWNASSCTMPSMSGSASQSDRWSSVYWFNYSY
ncbi:MAG: hypothetical protein GFH27_549313n112 [Chloroflexi bacterium AL-W]|nr:hypothetical protein [Chloroflexi bacterium AL-N1]NOK69535.1 hypothetical protein [Chloroflexi bacterium AL-N10]NOK77500.1 hypothetical protein [Chloroflexi bacterium AL-N5]NOK84351.1 hypothetical protein [Chloroflexi bacterium AL-W]NOK91483.1 hypothetical protein [Chloroflexi bacterium AL-N15]